jgi:DNA-binding transcriptional LysR family regulator
MVLSKYAEYRRWDNSKVMFDELLSRHGLSLERLRSFAAVADAGSIARVADGDPARQSLISRQIRELEEFFGAELTRRKGKGLELTDAGEELARQIRFQFQGLSDFKRTVANQPLEYKFGANNSVIEWLLIPALPTIEKRIDGIHVQLLDTRSRDIIHGLVDHRFDFGIVRKSAVVDPLKYAPLGKISYALYEPADWGVMDRTPEKLAVTEGSEFLKELSRAAESRKKPLAVTHLCTNFGQAAQLVRLGIAAAILPTLAEKFLGGTAKRIELPWLKKYRRDIGIAWHERLLETRPKAREMLAGLRQMSATE